MANKKQRAWYIDTHTAGEKIAIVEKATNAVTKDGYTSDYESVTEAKGLKIRGAFLDTDLSNNAMTGSYSNIPSRFHEYIVNKVIASGYKDPRHMDFDVAQYFDNQYEKGVKKAKRFTRSNYQTTGIIKQQDF